MLIKGNYHIISIEVLNFHSPYLIKCEAIQKQVVVAMTNLQYWL